MQYNVEGKVLGFVTEEPETVNLFGKDKLKQEITIGDATGRIIVTLYEKLISDIQDNKSYRFTHLSTRNHVNTMKLSSIMQTTINQIDDMVDIATTELEVHTKAIVGTIAQVQCTKKLKCGSCNKAIENINEDATKIKCNSCNLKSNVKSLKQSLFVRMNITDQENNINRLIAFYGL